jgi:hypothetical protein
VAQILIKIINQTPTPPSQLRAGLPPRLDDVVEKGLRKDKLKRYSTASEMVQDLIGAYGLEGTVERWGQASVAEIAQALAQAQPPAAKAFGVISDPPPAVRGGGSPMRVQTAGAHGGTADAVDVPKQNTGALIGLAVGALALIGLVAALLLR